MNHLKEDDHNGRKAISGILTISNEGFYVKITCSMKNFMISNLKRIKKLKASL